MIRSIVDKFDFFYIYERYIYEATDMNFLINSKNYNCNRIHQLILFDNLFATPKWIPQDGIFIPPVFVF